MNSTLQNAKSGDIDAFHQLYIEFESPLKSYLYRLLTDKDLVEDVSQDCFLKAFEKLKGFDERSSLKSWVFRIATNLAYDKLRNMKRWSPDVLDKAKDHAHNNDHIIAKMQHTSTYSRFDIREHIDFCFTCMAKVLPLDQQVAVILKDIYQFKVKEIALVLNKSTAAIKHTLRFGRHTMTDIFDSRCTLINKKGACHQCTELNAALNPKQRKQEMFISEKLGNEQLNKNDLYKIRKALVRGINPLQIEGREIHDVFMQINQKVEGEIQELNFKNDD